MESTEKSTEEETDLKTQLEELCTDLWWSSESDYPVEVVWQPPQAFTRIEASKGKSVDSSSPPVIEIIQQWIDFCEDNSPTTTVEVSDFFEQQLEPKGWHTADDKAQQAKLKQLKTLLETALQHLQVYRCGEVEVKAYVLGLTPEGAIAGVSTTLVET